MHPETNSRRVFLRVLAACAAAPSAGCSAAAEPEPVGRVDAGLTLDYPVGTLEPIGNLPVALGHDEGGFYAMTLTCTHEGCNMATSGQVDGNGLTCFCHGAQFDSDGNATRGPAKAPLAHFAVLIDATTGSITIDGNTEVSPDTRA